MLNPHVAAGASGAILDYLVLCFILEFVIDNCFFKTMGWNLIFVIALNIAFGIMVPQVDNGAHMGGLIEALSLPLDLTCLSETTSGSRALLLLAIS